MSTYAIGDVQGCFKTLQRLLTRIQFNPNTDHVWLAGDLVNRGPQSLEVLRWARDAGPAVIAILGNHDLRLLAIYHQVTDAKPGDTLQPILDAPDCDSLLAWLQQRKLLHYQAPYLMVHAGVVPIWDTATILSLAHEAETVLHSDQAPHLLRVMRQINPDRWVNGLQNDERLTFIIKTLTYMRVCDASGRLFLDFTGTPAQSPKHFKPWYTWPRLSDATIVCGHWSALGLHQSDGIIALDTGCVWGQHLTAVRLEDGVVFQEPSVL